MLTSIHHQSLAVFVGHGLLAFAIVASIAHARGAGQERAVAVGLLAAGFATIPDLDVLHPLVVLAVEPVGLGATPDAFWALSTAVHRTATHSLVVGAVTAVGVTAWAARGGTDRQDAERRAGRGLLAGCCVGALVALVGVVWAIDGAVSAGVVAAMALAGLALAEVGTRYGLGPGTVSLAAVVGLLSHPFGDLLTGQPPALLYPLPVDLQLARVSLHPDPTLHLVGAFLVELATVWLALLVLARVSGVQVRPFLGRRALAGVAYAAAVLVLPAPSLDAATGFVFSVLAMGVVAVPVRRPREGLGWRGLITALAAVTLAAVTYGLAHAVV